MLEILNTVHFKASLSDVNVTEKFLNTYKEWILSTRNNKILGLDRFKFTNYSQGTTESFDKFYNRYHKKRFRIWKGEYSYHKITFDSCGYNWKFLDDEELKPNDVIIISLPFADNGNSYRYEETLLKAEKINIPVLVDCCWFGTCSGIKFNFDYDCIDQVVFSLSKSFPVSRHRIGIRFSNSKDGLDDLNQVNYVNNFSQHVGLHLLKVFSPDYIFNKYETAQIKLCSKLQIMPSNCVNLATGGDSWKHLNRSGFFNRLCLSEELVK